MSIKYRSERLCCDVCQTYSPMGVVDINESEYYICNECLSKINLAFIEHTLQGEKNVTE